MHESTVNFSTSLLHKTDRFHVAVCSIINHRTPKGGKNINDTLDSSPLFLFLPHFDVIDL